VDIIEKRLDELKPYKNNPRKNDQAVDAVAASISAFGFKVPIVIDRDGEIVCGHTRMKAAKKLGLESVPCVVADDLTEEQIKAFRLADNKVGELAEWDIPALDLELADLDFDMGEFGFDLDAGQEAPTQNLNEGGEISSEQFSDEQFACTCPRCGFKFNPKE
jgi:site-specific DNA-methyltransferase (adenine-specific)